LHAGGGWGSFRSSNNLTGYKMTNTSLEKAINVLRNDEVIAYPTEAVWGLGCDPQNELAVRKLLKLKQRPMEKGLILVAATIEQFSPYLSQLSPDQYQQLQASWPGFRTWIVPAPDTVPKWLRGDHSGIALRVSAHPTVQALCLAFGGPLVSTSANLAGQPEALTAEQVENYFSDEVAFILPGALGDAAEPSPIVDLVTGQPLR